VPILVTKEGRLNAAILLQYLKALEPMVASWLVPAPNVTVFRLVHDWKADVPIDAKEAGRLSSVID
jgi:hypothetical protein